MQHTDRGSAQADNDGGVVPNYRSLEELVIPNKLLQRNDGDFLLFDSGPGEGRILLFGAASNLVALRNAEVWGSDGTFKVCPRLWIQVYTIHAVSEGYCIPCIYALLPGKSQGAYETMWGQVRELVGEDADKRRVLTVDFERASINAFEATFPDSVAAGCYFHLGQSVYRRAKLLGLAGKFGADDDSKLRVKKLSALAYLPLEKVVEGFEQLQEEFHQNEQELVAYFEATYIGGDWPGREEAPVVRPGVVECGVSDDDRKPQDTQRHRVLP